MPARSRHCKQSKPACGTTQYLTGEGRQMARKCRFEPGDLPGFTLPSSAENRSLAPDTWFLSSQLAHSQIKTAIIGSDGTICQLGLSSRHPAQLCPWFGRRTVKFPAFRSANQVHCWFQALALQRLPKHSSTLCIPKQVRWGQVEFSAQTRQRSLLPWEAYCTALRIIFSRRG